MLKIVLKFGLISGVIVAGLAAVLIPLALQNHTIEHGEILGYSIMVLAFLLVFFGIRSYRENVTGGAITFGKGFQVGILIALVGCAMYVIAWEVVYYNFLPDFAEKFASMTLDRMRARGETAQAIEAATKEMAHFKEIYKNPLVNSGMTFLEVFPVGLVMTLISAAILRRKKAPAA